jgi:hypothetical protein
MLPGMSTLLADIEAFLETHSMSVAIGLAWLLCLPFDLFARLGQRSRSDALDEQTCADWGSEHIHNGDVSI